MKYDFDELTEILYEIEANGDGDIDYASSISCLLNEINKLKDFNAYLMALIPLKYKKFNPSANPFFSVNDIKPDCEDFQKAKERMHSLLEKAKPKT